MVRVGKNNISFIISGLIICSLLMLMVVNKGKYFLTLSFGCLIFSMFPFYLNFEKKKIKAREVIFIAVLSAIAAVSRIPFAPLPSVQPVSFIVIVSALVLGPESGFIVGATSAIVSNIFLGQGPWTPWQMFCWGLMGITAGLIRNRKWAKNKYFLCAFGFIWGFLFGWIMNMWYVVAYISPINLKSVMAAYVASFYFDLMHALSNVFFIYFFYSSWYRIIDRFKKKYGILIAKD
ncbi:ECF transporter S component [Lentilactobacillus senioris]|uniref:ECF transporter S component n=1 Tax=Lentilactobacillus senioris TaxID=931534 RepID=UPI003D2E5EB6